jgi:hypothetical protein
MRAGSQPAIRSFDLDVGVFDQLAEYRDFRLYFCGELIRRAADDIHAGIEESFLRFRGIDLV